MYQATTTTTTTTTTLVLPTLPSTKSEFDYETLDLLKKTAMRSTVENKHAAALLKGNYKNKLIIGFNRPIKEKVKYKTIHAEVNAIFNFPYDKKAMRGMDIIVIRNKNGHLKNSRPCNHCIDKMITVGIRKVFYSNDDGDIVFEYLEEMERTHISSGWKHELREKE
jgi:deoxycytidylate deaminase